VKGLCHRDRYLKQQQTEKIETKVRDIDRIRIRKVYTILHMLSKVVFWRVRRALWSNLNIHCSPQRDSLSGTISFRLQGSYMSATRKARLHLCTQKNCPSPLTVLRARIIFLKKVHPAKRGPGHKNYILAGGTFIRWIYPDNLPPPPPGYSNDRNVLQACLSLAGEPGPDWAICGGGTGVNFFCNGCFWYHNLFLKISIKISYSKQLPL
jgi:hypothetical protein